MNKTKFFRAVMAYLAGKATLTQKRIVKGYDVKSSDEPDYLDTLSEEERKLIHDRMWYYINEEI